MLSESSKGDDQIVEENLRLKSSVEELSILNDIATAIASTQSLDQITKLIVNKCVKHLHSEQGSIQLFDEKDIVNPFQTMIRVRDNENDMDSLRFDKQLSDSMLMNRKPLIINKFKREEEISLQENLLLQIRSLLSVPMVIKGKMIGILSLFNKTKSEGFTESDQRLLSIVAAQSANVIENSRLFEEEKKLMQIRQEIQVASEIQKNLLPKEIISIDGYDMYATNIPAQEVGGDYYDFIKVSENKTAIVLGDVSGKGLPAAMLVANLQATLRGQLLFNTSIKDCISRSNTLLYESTDKRKFVTLFVAILDHNSNTITYCNGGHNLPFCFQGEKEINLDKGGIILGWQKSYEYSEEEIPFGNGSLLVIYSDGITEAFNKSEKMYGDERLFDLIRNNIELSSQELASKILDDVNYFADSAPQSDDITLMIIKRSK